MIKIALLQSNYLPWKGVFDLINRVDTFVFYEGVQYTKRDWRNRNRIMTCQGLRWITVPVKTRGRFRQKLSDVKIDTRRNWQRKHYKSFLVNYSKAPFFDDYRWIIDDIYLNNKWSNLSELNIFSTKMLCETLGIKTELLKMAEIPSGGEKDEKIIAICKSLGAGSYVSGPSARRYIDPEKFRKNNIAIEYMNYEYPVYKQLHGEFNHHVSVLDLIFNCGPEASSYIWDYCTEKLTG